ncbi:unnamed protein product [Cuscuta campestris]|uniref:Ninja-family protein n=1 Tax=Cuscuta campestris TaxID=132261 RepID=A0A484KSN2_9ASTE|nr:unnamed protein product [Cuscuta campestris]VFQ67618.1 unnamed protein product [Cuscuta campestris]
MEDENGLNLSLGLPCGRGTGSQKGKTGSSSNVRTEEGDRNSNSISDFKNFFDGGTKKVDSVTGSHKTDLAKNGGNFFSGLSSPTGHSDTTKRLNNGGFWSASSSRSIEVGGGRTTDASDSHKRKCDIDSHDKTMASHISINTDDDSTGDIEDVADSEAESHGQNEVNDKDVVKDSTELQGQKMFTISTEKEAKFGNMSYGPPFSQPVNITNMPCSLPLKNSSNPSGTVGVPSYPGARPLVPANMPLMFGYSHVQLSSLDKGNVCAPASHLHRQQIQPPNARGSLNTDMHGDSMKITQATSTPVVVHSSSGNGKHHPAEEGSSENARGNNNNNISFSGAKDPSSELPKATSAANGLPRDFTAIRPGLAADVKFGGCGSYPNLPWVSTTGLGPNGKTISGVTYRYSPTQIKIVCACHGSHMSPEEFVRHAGEERPTTTHEAVGGGTGLVSSFPNSNSAASAQS